MSLFKKDFYVSTDVAKLDITLIHDFLSARSHWAKGRDMEVVKKSVKYSLCFGVYDSNHGQVGFARVVTDFTVYAYILDLFIIETHRGKGLGKLLMQSIIDHEELDMVKNWALKTRGAHELYKQFGFSQVSMPERLMERVV